MTRGSTSPPGAASETEISSSQVTSPSSQSLSPSSSCTPTPRTLSKELLNLFASVRMEHLVAGLSGGVASTLILHPLDLIKTRFAVSDGLNSRPQYKSLNHAFTSIVRDDGFRGLYRGVTPNVWGAGAAWGLYFLFYNSLKTWLQGGDTTKNLGALTHVTIAAEAGLLTLALTNPLFVVKTRLCLQYVSQPQPLPIVTPQVLGSGSGIVYYRGMTDALVKIWKLEGMRGLYRGFVPGMFGVSHGAIQFMTYEEMKTAYNSYLERPIDFKLGTAEYLSFAAISKLIAAATTYPYQVVRARLQDQHRSYKGIWDVVHQTWRGEGFLGFYKGIIPNLIRVVPATAITFVVYEETSAYLTSWKKSQI